MKRLLRYTGFLLAIVAAALWSSVRGPATSAPFLGYVCSAATAQGDGPPPTPAEQFKTLLKEFHAAAHAHFQSTTTDEERAQGVARVAQLTSRCLELVEKNPGDPIALEALTQVVTLEYWLNTHTSHPGWGKDSRQARAIALLLRDHLQSDLLGETCKRVHFGFRQECETFLRAVLEKNPHREVRGQACLRLAQFLANRRERLELLKGQPELARRYEGLYGKDYLEALRRQDRAQVMQEAEAFYERARDSFSDVKLPYGELVGEAAKTELFEIRHLAVGKETPDIEGVDQDGGQLKLSDYRGKVVLLYFWSEF
ncbi:MAG: redoxin domain-containing protein [Verrucomicrobia bacterium]|nr:redoxin domain-containing protein [Verrucomicrobiota bacterium]